MPTNVVYGRDFVRYIKVFQVQISQDDQMPEVVDTIRQWVGAVRTSRRSRPRCPCATEDRRREFGGRAAALSKVRQPFGTNPKKTLTQPHL